MKRMMSWAMCTAGLLLGACGGQAPVGTGAGGVASGPAVTGEWEGQSISVRMLGVDSGAYEGVRLPVRALHVTAGGKLLPVEELAAEVDLSQENHAPLVGRFVLPAGVELVEVSVEFGSAGTVTRAGTTESVDLRIPPIRFTSHAAWLSRNHHAVVHLNVARSVVPTASGLLLLPSLTVHH